MAGADLKISVKITNAQVALMAANTQLQNAPVTAGYITERAESFKNWLDAQDERE